MTVWLCCEWKRTILLAADPLCLHILASQSCLGTLSSSPMSKVAWNSTTRGPPSVASCRRRVGVSSSRSGRCRVKSYEICPLNNQRPNQFVQRAWEVGGLQRNGQSMRWPSAYLRQTHKSPKAWETRWLGGGDIEQRDIISYSALTASSNHAGLTSSESWKCKSTSTPNIKCC